MGAADLKLQHFARREMSARRARLAIVQGWQKFEHLVARIHQVLDGEQFVVEHDVTITEPTGATHQIDVLLTPKSPFLGRILVSCKSSTDPVGMDHVREWADVVHQTGGSAGVIVSPTGYTSGAIDLAKNPSRRVSLWIARPLTDDDFAPNARSPAGYIRTVGLTMRAQVLQPRLETLKIDAVPASGIFEGRAVTLTFSAQTRNQYYLRDEQDNIVGNLWDDYIVAGEALRATGVARVVPTEPRFLVIEGRRMRFNSFSMEIELFEHVMKFEIDVARGRYAYENAVTGEVKMVPLSHLDSWSETHNTMEGPP